MADDRVYKLYRRGAVMFMTNDDFAHFAGELIRYGVDVEILDNEAADEVWFKLKEIASG